MSEEPKKIGRPLKFKTVEELTQKIDGYFTVTPKEEWTITGLAIHLDTFRKVLIDYESGKYDEEDREFSYTIKKAKHMVENSYEIDLKKHGRSGTIFALKNFDWKDKTESDLTVTLPKPLLSNIKPNVHSDNSAQQDTSVKEED